METINLAPIANAVIILCATIITSVVVPYVRKKNTEAKWNDTLYWVRIGVKAVEQMYKNGDIPKDSRLDAVFKFMQNHGYALDFGDLKMMIESVVKELPKTGIVDDVTKDQWTLPEVEENE